MRYTFQKILKDEAIYRDYLRILKDKYLDTYPEQLRNSRTILPQEIIRDFFLDHTDVNFEDAVDQLLRLSDEQMKIMDYNEIDSRIKKLQDALRYIKYDRKSHMYEMLYFCIDIVIKYIKKKCTYIKNK